MSKGAQAPCCVTLVHGTFSDSSVWTEPFLEQVRREAGDDVEFHRFAWSGANSQHERLKAAQALRTHLLDLRDRRGLPQIVIGHSHGGTVALYAARHRDVRRCVRGIACLGTPFFDVRPRSLRLAAGWTLLGLAATVAALLLPVVALAFVWANVGWPRPMSSEGVGMIVLEIVVRALAISILLRTVLSSIIHSPRIAGWIRATLFVKPGRVISRWQRRALARYPRYHLDQVSLLYVFFSGKDSAHRWLQIWTRIVDAPLLLASYVVLPLLIVASIVIEIAIFVTRPALPSTSGMTGIVWLLAQVLLVLEYALVAVANVGFFVGVVQIAWICSGSIRNRVWSFGAAGFWSNWLMQIRSVQDPPSNEHRRCKLDHIEPYLCDVEDMPPQSRVRLIFSRYHSMYYQSAVLGGRIGRWIVAVL
jgi:pimeloyl-ACP methyl ester carboxylesterase